MQVDYDSDDFSEKTGNVGDTYRPPTAKDLIYRQIF
jgi:hypothetical protein